MSTKTEARNEIQEPVAPQVSGIDSNDQDRQHHGGLWVLAVALVAFAGLAAAVAIEVFDGSSSNDTVTTVFVDPRLDSDFHRTPGLLSPKDPIPVETDTDTYLRISGLASTTDRSRSRPTTTPTSGSPGRAGRPRTPASRPSTRTSSGRPTRPPRRKRRRWFARFGSTPPARWSRPDPGFRTRSTDPPGSAARPASGSQGGQPTRWPHPECGQQGLLRGTVGRSTTMIRTPPHINEGCARIGGHGDVRGGRRGAVGGPRVDP